MAVVEVSIVPLGTESSSVSKHVARAIKILQTEDEVKHTSTAMGTIIEGDLEKVMEVIRRMHESAFSGEVMRVITTIRIDDRRDKSLTIDGKLDSLKRELG